MNLRRVLILADESADWVVAGLRQLDRLALALDEFAGATHATEPMLVCIFWRADLDQSQRWIPNNPQLTKVAFTTEPDNTGYDLVLSTRLFLYRRAIGCLFSEGRASARPSFAADVIIKEWDVRKHVPAGAGGAWEYITNIEQIDGIERRFLRASGKSQDGLVSRYLNRPLSRTITRLLLRSSVTPNAWTWLIFPVVVVAALLLARGTYWSFVWGLLLFQLFSILDGCDGEIARAKFMESESGRRLDDLFDVLSNILLVLGLGFGLRQAHDRFGWLFLAEGIVTAVLIALNEWLLARATTPASSTNSLGETLYPRHRALVERSGLGEKFASVIMQLTKRDVAILFFLLLAAVGFPALILHLLLAVTAITLAFALK